MKDIENLSTQETDSYFSFLSITSNEYAYLVILHCLITFVYQDIHITIYLCSKKYLHSTYCSLLGCLIISTNQVFKLPPTPTTHTHTCHLVRPFFPLAPKPFSVLLAGALYENCLQGALLYQIEVQSSDNTRLRSNYRTEVKKQYMFSLILLFLNIKKHVYFCQVHQRQYCFVYSCCISHNPVMSCMCGKKWFRSIANNAKIHTISDMIKFVI